MSVKLDAVPESVKLETDASTDEPAIVIPVDCQFELLIAPVLPLIVADALVNVTEPKSANGKTPE